MTFVWALSFSFSLISLEGKRSPFELTRLCCIYLTCRTKLSYFVVITFKVDFRNSVSSVLGWLLSDKRTRVLLFTVKVWFFLGCFCYIGFAVVFWMGLQTSRFVCPRLDLGLLLSLQRLEHV